jgi:BirA family biotin operon repressor/biotin-[acetyl-CoA-carboxylase] ligase
MIVRLHPTILRFASLPSTNTEAARQAVHGAPEGLCIVADEQTAGRGRQHRTWVSRAGAGLYVSILLRPRLDLSEWPLITLMASLAVRHALLDACALQTDIKWPNDIYSGERKLCGILAETVETEMRGGACIVGIGINLNERAVPHALQETATSVERETGSAPDRETLLQALVSSISRRYATLEGLDGVVQTLREWSAASSYAEGRRVRVALLDETFVGTTRGLASDGALRVETREGEIRTVRAGDVTALRGE